MDTIKYGLMYVNEIKYDDIAWSMLGNGKNIEIINTEISIYSKNRSDIEKVIAKLAEKSIEVAISMNFCPAISDACMELGIKYVAWVYDMPQQGLYEDQIYNECNYIFSFDKIQVLQLLQKGVKNVYHLPLATNIYRNAGLVVNERDEAEYSCDISFVGSMYSENYYNAVKTFVSEPTNREINNIISTAYGKWDGINRINGQLSEKALDELWNINGNKMSIDHKMGKDDFLGAALFSRYLANLERTNILIKLNKYNIRLYTTDKNIVIPGVRIGSELSYDEQLPKAYFLSKINLNITLHSIISGIPLRVFDIMGVGGFMLTNYQPEIEDYFLIGKDIEVYRDIDELVDKVDFYLKNENSRLRIALNGYKVVSEKHSYDNRINEILEKLDRRLLA